MLQPGNKTSDVEIAMMILRYLLKHPGAKDTLQGIATWWLLQERIDQTIERVSSALDYLVEHKLVKTTKFQNQGTIYLLNEEKLEDIEIHLKKHSAFDGRENRSN